MRWINRIPLADYRSNLRSCLKKGDERPWSPGRLTIVLIGQLPFRLTIYESTEHVDVRYEWDKAIPYLRVSQAPTKRRPTWAGPATTYKQHMPSGYLAVRAYSPHGRVTWEQRWTEATAGALMRKVTTVVKEVEAIAPSLVERREEAEKEAAIERERREAQWREHERQEQARRRAEARARRASSICSRLSTTGHSPATSRASSRMRSVGRRRSRPKSSRRCANASAARATCSAGPTRWSAFTSGNPRTSASENVGLAHRDQARGRKPIHTYYTHGHAAGAFRSMFIEGFEWLRGRDLNPRPLGYEPNELPDCSTPRHLRNPQCSTVVVHDARNFDAIASRGRVPE